jgi:hypothetical protein
MSGSTGQPGSDSEDQIAATDPVELIRRHCRSITNALRVVDLEHPGAGPVTRQCAAILDTLLVSVSELRHFTKNRKGTP